MRTQKFEGLNPVYVDIHRIVPGGQDPNTGRELPPRREYYAQNALGDLQPKGGAQRAAESGTVWESTHTLILDRIDKPIRQGDRVDIRLMIGGEVLETFEVVFAPYYGGHYELDLRRVKP